jgi:hypothetical protein
MATYTTYDGAVFIAISRFFLINIHRFSIFRFHQYVKQKENIRVPTNLMAVQQLHMYTELFL